MKRKKVKGFGVKNDHDQKSITDITKRTMTKWQRKAVKGDIDCQMKLTNYYNALFNKYSYEEGSTMIHEKDYEPMNCCLCGKEMTSIHDTHNPYPLTPKCYPKDALENKLPHRCCSSCQETKVFPARLEIGGSGYVLVTDWFRDANFKAL